MSLSDIQRHVGVTPDGKWGPVTAKAIAKALGMVPKDGFVNLRLSSTYNKKRDDKRSAFGTQNQLCITERKLPPLAALYARKQPQLQMFCGGLQKPGVCQKALQRPLHKNEEGARYVFARSSQSRVERVRRMRESRRSEGRVGLMQSTLQIPSPSSHSKDMYRRNGWVLHPVQRKIPSASIRFSSPERRQVIFPEQLARRRFGSNHSGGGSQMCLVMRQLPQDRAS